MAGRSDDVWPNFMGFVTFLIVLAACIFWSATGGPMALFWLSVPIALVATIVVIYSVVRFQESWNNSRPIVPGRTMRWATGVVPASASSPPPSRWARWETEGTQQRERFDHEQEIERIAVLYNLPNPTVKKFDALVRSEIDRERREQSERLARIAEALPDVTGPAGTA
jgi:hypothetical protein